MALKPTLLLGTLQLSTLVLNPPAAADAGENAIAHLYGLRASYDDCLNKAAGDIPPMMACIRTELAY